MNDFKEFFEKAQDFVDKKVEDAKEKANAAIEPYKVKYQISTKKEELEGMLAKYGRAQYEMNIDDSKEIAKEIANKKKEIQELEAYLEEITKAPIYCTKCGTVHDEDDDFCRKCGKELKK